MSFIGWRWHRFYDKTMTRRILHLSEIQTSHKVLFSITVLAAILNLFLSKVYGINPEEIAFVSGILLVCANFFIMVVSLCETDESGWYSENKARWYHYVGIIICEGIFALIIVCITLAPVWWL